MSLQKGNMADYYTNFSLVVNLPDQAAQQYALELANKASQVHLGEEAPKDFPAPLLEVVEDWNFEIEADSPAEEHGIRLHSQCGGIDAVCAFIQHLLQKFNPEARVEFEWSNDCSKPRVDAYGGGAAIITAQEIQTMSTGQWLQQKA